MQYAIQCTPLRRARDSSQFWLGMRLMMVKWLRHQQSRAVDSSARLERESNSCNQERGGQRWVWTVKAWYPSMASSRYLNW